MGPKRKQEAKQIGITDCINWYELEDVKAFGDDIHNPAKDHHSMSVPFRMACIGGSGAGKTLSVMNIIKAFCYPGLSTFTHIELYTKNADEQLYRYLRNTIPPEMLAIHDSEEGIQALMEKDLNKDYKDQHTLCIFDDLVLEHKKVQAKISEYFIRGRKAGNGISCIYLSQKWCGIPAIIRAQLNYIIIKKISSMRDLRYIIRDLSTSLSVEQVYQLYKDAIKDNVADFFMIDLQAPSEQAFRKNFICYDITEWLN